MPAKNKKILFRAWYLFIYWDLLISYVPYKLWKNKLFKSKHTFSDVALTDVLIITRLIEKVARNHFVSINCLRRCTVQKHILDSLGYPTQLVFGVKKQQDNLEAHCWLTFKNQIINDSLEETSTYVPLVNKDSEHKNVLKNLKNRR
ncbi:lasso peptide biosynthesis B2 protein [Paraglaciecola aquimarina]|uniref:Lasso peptide biosynthesis B2 protein n=1 Tax=Paraglaciecola algarum TaxID=3050085 RepID=A0ABS9DAC3_9ALTE|nr:lasso peptide biosynthesis B2 protein [Paraglaciecola sp. G1-23]MCF2949906.1 lasso peptide biosynthesis B2 protein [Paraglaciecola sp. G1-23]